MTTPDQSNDGERTTPGRSEPSEWAREKAAGVVLTDSRWARAANDERFLHRIALALDEARAEGPKPHVAMCVDCARKQYRRGFLACRERAPAATRRVEEVCTFGYMSPGQAHGCRCQLRYAAEAIERLEPDA